MSRYSLPLVFCVYFVLNVEGLLQCNLTLRYAYYEYVLNATCETRCLFPLLGTLTFRDHIAERHDLNDPGAWTATASLIVMGSFWGEYLDCRLPGHLLICVTLIAVNKTITLNCHGRNGIWPPFAGPFLSETDDNSDDDLFAMYPDDDDLRYFHPDVIFRDRPDNVSQNSQTPNVTETAPQENHIAKITCIVMILVTICVLLYYLPKNGTILHHYNRRSRQLEEKKYTPSYVAIKDI